MFNAGPILRAEDDVPVTPPFRWTPYIMQTIAIAAVTAVGTKLGEWCVEHLRERLKNKTTETKS